MSFPDEYGRVRGEYPTTDWSGHRDYSTSYSGDEFYPRHSWTYEKCILPSVVQHMRVRIVVRIQGVARKRPKPKTSKRWEDYDATPCQPIAFYARLERGGSSTGFAQGTCRTIKQALAKVDSIDISLALKAFLRSMQHPTKAHVVFQEQRDGSFEPLCSRFGTGWTNTDFLPSGHFLCIGWDFPVHRAASPRLDVYEVHKDGGSTMSGNMPHARHVRLAPEVLAQLPYQTSTEFAASAAGWNAYLKERWDDLVDFYVLGTTRKRRKRVL